MTASGRPPRIAGSSTGRGGMPATASASSAQQKDELRALELARLDAVQRGDERDSLVLCEAPSFLRPARGEHHHRLRVVVSCRVRRAADAIALDLEPLRGAGRGAGDAVAVQDENAHMSTRAK